MTKEGHMVRPINSPGETLNPEFEAEMERESRRQARAQDKEDNWDEDEEN